MSESTVPATASNGTTYSVPFFINGEEVHPEKQFDVVSPATGNVIHQCGSASVVDAFASVDAAAAAFKSWRKTPPGQKRDILWKASEILLERKDELAQYQMDETGATRAWADLNIKIATDILKDVAGRIATIEGMIPGLADENSSGLVLKEPYGVVLAIAPWYVMIRVVWVGSSY
jgi:acyl-CoA reductase-like NAD-dependent aldehyde dehydrogenase